MPRPNIADISHDRRSRAKNDAPNPGAPDQVRFGAIASGPLARFHRWFREAERAGIARAEAMALATADRRGRPSVRFVLLKRCDDRGLVFFTNARSVKGRQIRENPRAAAVFFWEPLGRQVLISGAVGRIADADSNAYWASRPRGSRLAAMASTQSAPLNSRRELVARVARLRAALRGKEVPRPPEWRGFILRPEAIEFWTQRANRLHDRELFVRARAGWKRTRLQP